MFSFVRFFGFVFLAIFAIFGFIGGLIETLSKDSSAIRQTVFAIMLFGSLGCELLLEIMWRLDRLAQQNDATSRWNDDCHREWKRWADAVENLLDHRPAAPQQAVPPLPRSRPAMPQKSADAFDAAIEEEIRPKGLR